LLQTNKFGSALLRATVLCMQSSRMKKYTAGVEILLSEKFSNLEDSWLPKLLTWKL